MHTIIGIFPTRHQALEAITRLKQREILDSNISIIYPGSFTEEVIGETAKYHVRAEHTGTALGSIAGTSIGIATGPLLTTVFVTGIGLISILAGAATMGIVGAIAGAAIGHTVEYAATHSLPKEDVHIYEDILRNGKSIVAVIAQDEQVPVIEQLFKSLGASDNKQAQKDWWNIQRSNEKKHYERMNKEEFEPEEPRFRKGFEAALHPDFRGKEYSEIKEELKQHHSSDHESASYQQGFQRGQEYYDTLRKNVKPIDGTE